jgi:hypothetical protein
MEDIIIKEVKDKVDLKWFIQYPRKQLYKDCPYYVPNLDSSDYKTLVEHPAKQFCDIRLWLAYKNGKLAGRIAGIINHRYNELKNKKRIRFGWFDVENDLEVAKALFAKIEEWAKEKFLLEIAGPSRFSNMEKQGMLIENFEEMPSFSCEYNYSYYPELINQLGFQKEVDYIQFLNEEKGIPLKIKNVSEYLLQRYNIRLKKFTNKKELFEYGHQFFEALNKSFQDIYNFIPLTDTEMDYLIQTNFKFIDEKLISLVVDENNQIIGINLCVPALNKAFKKANGKLFPFGWYHILKAFRKNDTVDLYLTGVLPEWIPRGVHAVYHYELHTLFIERGYKYAVTNQQLENISANQVWEKYNGKIISRRRCYVKNI